MSALTDAFDTWRRIPLGEHNTELEVIMDAARRVANAQDIVDDQAKDEGLWFTAVTAPEAYLQQELRRLHAALDQEDV